MNRIITITALAGSLIGIPAAALADEPSDGCYMGDYQGVPLEMCPVQEPDPTNCYTGDYQGAPIEICMPTGVTLPPGTIDRATGLPTVIHNSKDYVPPTTVPAVVAAPAPAPVVVAPSWMVGEMAALQAALVAAGSF